MAIEIELDWIEIIDCLIVAAFRRYKHTRKNTTETQGANRIILGWNAEVEGNMGEKVIAKWLKIYWKPDAKNIGAPDIGKTVSGRRIEVRTTPYQNGHLPIYQKDNDESVFFLVVGIMPRYKIVGWIFGGDAKRNEWWGKLRGDRKEQYNVPQQYLHEPETFDMAI